MKFIDEWPDSDLFRNVYPWDDWLAEAAATGCKILVFTPGEDFTAGMVSFRSSLSAALKKRGFRLRTHVMRHEANGAKPGDLVVQILLAPATPRELYRVTPDDFG